MFAKYQTRQHFGSLDGLRCLSILAVIWHHTGSVAFRHIPLATRGFLGVDLFFVISGFLITTLLLRERQRTGDIALAKFYARRTLRIFPLYYAVLAIYVLLTAFVERDQAIRSAFFHHLPWFASYTTNWFVKLESTRVIFYFAWSLAAEEQFYLVWPTIEKRLASWAVVVGVAIVAVTTWVQSGAADGVLTPGSFAHEVIGHTPRGIILGVLLAHALADQRAFRFLARVLGAKASAPLALLALFACLLPANFSPAMVHLTMVWLVGACVIREDHGLSFAMRWPPVVHVGVVSYGAYLMHMLAFNLVKRVMERLHFHDGIVVFVASASMAVVLATLSFRYYESWFLRLKQKFAVATGSTPIATLRPAMPLIPANNEIIAAAPPPV